MLATAVASVEVGFPSLAAFKVSFFTLRIVSSWSISVFFLYTVVFYVTGSAHAVEVLLLFNAVYVYKIV